MSIRFALGVAAAASLIGGAAFAAYGHGRAVERAEQWKHRAEASDAVLQDVRALVRIGSDIGARAEANMAEVRTQTTTIVPEVPRYVSAETDARFPLPVGFVRVHDAAALGAVLPGPAPELDGQASDVVASEAATITALNYGACREDRARLAGLQEWAAQVSAETGR